VSAPDALRYFVMTECSFSVGFVLARLLTAGMWRKDRVRFIIAASTGFYAAAGIYFEIQLLGHPLHPGTFLLLIAATLLIAAQAMIWREQNGY
jgi:hypothetical protein